MRALPILAALLLATGCTSDPADAPPEAEPPASAESAADPDPPADAPGDGLTGAWAHVASADTPDGPREPLTGVAISWTFRPDGTGTYSQQVGSGETRTNDFEWTLDGETIDMGTLYTIVSRDGDEMVWRNERMGNYYVVHRP
jgi:hypothetical protein